ncbi:MAG: hypothetical protein IT429_17110 [Gemmataceae bacterium]|nr:hypothetical protein [Gemmataceae bacterium]
MRRILLYTAAGLLLVLGLLGSAGAREPAGGKVKPTGTVLDKPAAECTGDHGTAVKFFKNPSEAARSALKEEKLVFVLHISGLFENPDFT